MQNFDYIIVGAGSAGCPVARELSADPANRVLLIEAGPHADRFWVNTPAGMAKLYFHKTLNWNYHTEASPQLNNRQMYWPRGKTLGGSSAINGMVFIRGHRGDFDDWRDLGNPGWGYDDVLPHFKAMERFERGGDAWRGDQGPLTISDPVVKSDSSRDFIRAAVSLGHPETHDMNGQVHDGVGFMQHNIKRGRRQSAYVAFVKPVLDRPNLTVMTGAHVQRVLFLGREAVGVELVDGRQIGALREVILSGGAINSAQTLMLSGVGPGAELQRHGIALIHESPGVGQNLQDHFYIHTGWRATADSSYNANLAGLRKYWEGFRYLMTRRGYLALGSSQVAAFVKSHPDAPRADLQISFRPMTFAYFPDGTVAVERQPGMGVSVYQLRPRTMGTVTLRSGRATDKAVCAPHFLTDPYDIGAMISGIKQIRQIMGAPPIAARVVAEEVPGPGVRTDEDILRFMVETGNSAHHQGGTCRMGRDALAVVDERLRVRGVERLRVVDASVMPNLTSGNTNAPTIMIGVKGGAMIREDATPRRQV
ncbi:GMC family oxidoreductase N-terminal domain-containing protein [Rhodobacter sp. KR11]|uniref:GMC family oxidoreductase n=1 Tax=Rhodobacter sp. KR11 TaxID=2974588 RepID=UPI002221FE9C|nr:GMC family oxidoreductase N-terminal domain-containing protein [Rhodobacter sp. KR11]MCW1918089.1 GMC family oxidoreductase N-terminal domain-containing protein [Rhodobacter sp. KR11]